MMATKAEEEAARVLADMAAKYGGILPSAKIIFVETAQGWRFDLHFITGEILVGTEMFASKLEAAETIADRINASGVNLGKLS
jgi:uncharacterized protein YegP (UPF0339 family)